MITYTIKKTVGEKEYVVRYHKDGKFMPTWTSDKQDAEDTAKSEVERMAANG